MWKLTAFGIGTLLLIYISRASLRATRSHGFYRFLAWEAILALCVINIEFWFRDPFVWNQIIAWTLLFAAFVPLISGVRALTLRGKPVADRDEDPSLLGFEKTTQLVTSGIYKYIRHPLYSSLLLLTWGIFFKHLSAAGIALAVAATVFLVFTARADESECIQFFGAEYQDYMKQTKRFIPFLF
jgi:protein-S-isoprenylcysteine O-methyltransferase Ste14